MIIGRHGEHKEVIVFSECYCPLSLPRSPLEGYDGNEPDDLDGFPDLLPLPTSSSFGSQESAAEAEEMIAQMIMSAMEELVYENREEQGELEEILEKANLLLEKANALSEELVRKVTLQEVSEQTGFSVEEIQEILRITGWKIEVIDI